MERGGQHLSWNLRARSLKIYCQSSIYEKILGGTVGFKFEFAYKLQMDAQRKTLCILRIEVLSYQVRMNLENFEALVAISAFDKLFKATQELLTRIMPVPMETASVGGSMVS